jgi:hypothetical protein
MGPQRVELTKILASKRRALDSLSLRHEADASNYNFEELLNQTSRQADPKEL